VRQQVHELNSHFAAAYYFAKHRAARVRHPVPYDRVATFTLDQVLPCGTLVRGKTRNFTINPDKRHECISSLDKIDNASAMWLACFSICLLVLIVHSSKVRHRPPGSVNVS